jgi:UDP-glucose 4-epimerase
MVFHERSSDHLVAPRTAKPMQIREDQPTNPITAYGVSKLSIKSYLSFFGRQSEMKIVSLRVASPFGPRQNVQNAQGALTTFCNKAILGE